MTMSVQSMGWSRLFGWYFDFSLNFESYVITPSSLIWGNAWQLHFVLLGLQPSATYEFVFAFKTTLIVLDCWSIFQNIWNLSEIFLDWYPLDKSSTSIFLILDFVCKQQNNCLQWLLASIDIISQEKIVQCTWLSSLIDHIEQVCILAVDVAHNTNRFLNLN